MANALRELVANWRDEADRASKVSHDATREYCKGKWLTTSVLCTQHADALEAALDAGTEVTPDAVAHKAELFDRVVLHGELFGNGKRVVGFSVRVPDSDSLDPWDETTPLTVAEALSDVLPEEDEDGE